MPHVELEPRRVVQGETFKMIRHATAGLVPERLALISAVVFAEHRAKPGGDLEKIAADVDPRLVVPKLVEQRVEVGGVRRGTQHRAIETLQQRDGRHQRLECRVLEPADDPVLDVAHRTRIADVLGCDVTILECPCCQPVELVGIVAPRLPPV